MRKRAFSLILSTLVVTAALAGAASAQQSPAQQQPAEGATPTPTQSHSEGTKPENMGSTGWTGGTGGSHIGTSNTLTEQGSATSGSGSADTRNLTPNSETAKDQPLMATGVDLKGPPTRFPANQTPE